MDEARFGSMSAFAEVGKQALGRFRGKTASARTRTALHKLFEGVAEQRNRTYHQVGSDLVTPGFSIRVTPLLTRLTGQPVQVSSERAPHQQIIVSPGLQIYPAGPEVGSDVGAKYAIDGVIARLPDVLAGRAVSECTITFLGSPQARFGRITPEYFFASLVEGFAPLARLHSRSIEQLLANSGRSPQETALLLHGVSLGGPVVDELAAQLKGSGVLEGRSVSIQKVNPTQYPDDLKSELDKMRALATVLFGMGQEQRMAELDPVKRAYERSNQQFQQEIEPLVRSGQLREYRGATQIWLKKLQVVADLFNLYRYLNKENTHGVDLKTTIGIHDFAVFLGDRKGYILQAIKYGELPIITERGSIYISTDSSHYAHNYNFKDWVPALNSFLS